MNFQEACRIIKNLPQSPTNEEKLGSKTGPLISRAIGFNLSKIQMGMPFCAADSITRVRVLM